MAISEDTKVQKIKKDKKKHTRNQIREGINEYTKKQAHKYNHICYHCDSVGTCSSGLCAYQPKTRQPKIAHTL